MNQLMSAARLKRGMVVAALAGLALSSVVFGAAASASAKLPSSGVETPSGGTVTETGSTLLYPLFNLWAGGYNTKFPEQHHPDGGHRFGHRDLRGRERHHRHRRLRRLPVPERRVGQPGPEEHPAGHLGADGGLQRPRRPLAPEADREAGLSQIYQGQITTWNNSQIASLNSGVTLPATPIVDAAPLGQQR